ncbi:helix-turn-helix transcriptional regulator [Microbulbifer sp. TRSA007]|uniref:helix-turn-helix transcriptional regulator n=2 Tax=Microbulbifer TaxID=48073 RepID=UPI00403A0B7E
MEVKVNSKKIIKLRTTRAWSQQQLADVASLSLRTIQRIEKSGNASQDSIKAISSAFSLKPIDIILQENPKISMAKQGRKYLTAILALGTTLLLYTSLSSASPIMLKVDASTRNENLASVRLLNNEGDESEIQIENTLRFEVSAEQVSENQIRLQTKIYEFGASSGYKQIARPILVTGFNQAAEVEFKTSNGTPFKIQITPEI